MSTFGRFGDFSNDLEAVGQKLTRYLLLQTIMGRIPVYSGMAGYTQEKKWVQFLWLYLFCEVYHQRATKSVNLTYLRKFSF